MAVPFRNETQRAHWRVVELRPDSVCHQRVADSLVERPNAERVEYCGMGPAFTFGQRRIPSSDGIVAQAPGAQAAIDL